MAEREKEYLLMESGIRFHTTRYTRDMVSKYCVISPMIHVIQSNMPNGFAMKLRKHIKQHRIEDIYQVSTICLLLAHPELLFRLAWIEW